MKYFSAFISLVILDQLSKYIIRHYDGFYICNPNLAFGIKPIFSLIIIIFAILAIFNRQKTTEAIKNHPWEMIFVISGAVANFSDRIYHGCVIDFISLPFWPIFNLADVFIVLGAMLILLKSFRKN